MEAMDYSVCVCVFVAIETTAIHPWPRTDY